MLAPIGSSLGSRGIFSVSEIDNADIVLSNQNVIMRESGLDSLLAADELAKRSLINPATFIDNKIAMFQTVAAQSVELSRVIDVAVQNFLGDAADNFLELRNQLGKELAVEVLKIVKEEVDNIVSVPNERVLDSLTYK